MIMIGCPSVQVKFDAGDDFFPEFHLQIDDFSHRLYLRNFLVLTCCQLFNLLSARRFLMLIQKHIYRQRVKNAGQFCIKPKNLRFLFCPFITWILHQKVCKWTCKSWKPINERFAAVEPSAILYHIGKISPVFNTQVPYTSGPTGLNSAPVKSRVHKKCTFIV